MAYVTDFSISMSKHFQGDYQKLNEENYKNLLEEIIQSNNTIRFTAICGNFGTITEKLQREDVSLLLSEKDTEKLVGEAIHSWQTRRKFAQKIGEGQYAMAVYGKIIRLTIPLNEGQILLVTLDNTLESPKFVDDIKKILQKSPDVELEDIK